MSPAHIILLIFVVSQFPYVNLHHKLVDSINHLLLCLFIGAILVLVRFRMSLSSSIEVDRFVSTVTVERKSFREMFECFWKTSSSHFYLQALFSGIFYLMELVAVFTIHLSSIDVMSEMLVIKTNVGVGILILAYVFISLIYFLLEIVIVIKVFLKIFRLIRENICVPAIPDNFGKEPSFYLKNKILMHRFALSICKGRIELLFLKYVLYKLKHDKIYLTEDDIPVSDLKPLPSVMGNSYYDRIGQSYKVPQRLVDGTGVHPDLFKEYMHRENFIEGCIVVSADCTQIYFVPKICIKGFSFDEDFSVSGYVIPSNVIPNHIDTTDLVQIYFEPVGETPENYRIRKRAQSVQFTSVSSTSESVNGYRYPAQPVYLAKVNISNLNLHPEENVNSEHRTLTKNYLLLYNRPDHFKGYKKLLRKHVPIHQADPSEGPKTCEHPVQFSEGHVQSSNNHRKNGECAILQKEDHSKIHDANTKHDLPKTEASHAQTCAQPQEVGATETNHLKIKSERVVLPDSSDGHRETVNLHPAEAEGTETVKSFDETDPPSFSSESEAGQSADPNVDPDDDLGIIGSENSSEIASADLEQVVKFEGNAAFGNNDNNYEVSEDSSGDSESSDDFEVLDEDCQ